MVGIEQLHCYALVTKKQGRDGNWPESAPDMHHRAGRRYKARLADMVACFLVINGLANEIGEFVIAGAVLHSRGEIVLAHREQAGANLAVGGDAHAAAMPAERMRNGSNNADFADAILEDIAARRLAAGLA